MNKSEQAIYNAIISGCNICTDSRNTSNNSIFFALKGEIFDGNSFANDALEKGCKLAVVDNPNLKKNERLITVHNVLETLQNIALYHRNQFDIPFLGITGTNGKTTTKELISSVLSKKFKTYSTEGNLNNHIGVPITLLSIRNDAEIAVIEMGANHVGEIKNLCNLSKPTHGIITNIGVAHMEGFGSIENIAKAKSELYDFLKTNKGKVFVNYDNSKLMKLSEDLPKVTYGTSTNAGYIGNIEENKQFLKISYSIKNKTNKYKVNTNLIGSYNFENILAAISAGLYFGVKTEDIKEAIETYTPTNNRSQFIESKHNRVLMDAYNANPSSMKLAIENFASMNMTNKVAILGDMLELGKTAYNEHLKILETALKQNFNKILLVGKEFSNISKQHNSVTVFSETEDLISWLKKNPLKNKSILIKASRGIELEKILNHI